MKFFIQIACVVGIAVTVSECAPNSTVIKPPGGRDFEGSAGSGAPIRATGIQKNATVPFTIFRRSASNDTKPIPHREARQTISVVPVGSGLNVTSPSTSTSNKRNSTVPARPKPVRTNSTSSHPIAAGAPVAHNPSSSSSLGNARPVRASEDDAPHSSLFATQGGTQEKEEKHPVSSSEEIKGSEDPNRPHRPVFGNFGSKVKAPADAESL